MKIKILLMAVVLAGLLISLSASAQIECTCDDPITTQIVCNQLPVDGSLGTDLDGIIQIPRFNPNLGCLQEVKVTSQSCGYIWAIVDNEAQIDQVTWEVTATSGVRVTLPDGLGSQLAQFGTVDGPVDLITPIDDATPVPEPVNPLNPSFNPDFVGADSKRIDFGSPENPICSAPEDGEFIFTSEEDLQKFIGGGSLPVTVKAEGEAGATGPSSNVGFISFSQMNAKVCVEYTYCPPQKFCINGTKINDCTGEPISGWQICLSNSSGQIACIETDTNGEYSFCGLTPGDYQVCEETRDGWVHVDPVDRCQTVTLVDADEEGVDFVNAPLSCISGHKFNSLTNAGLSGWTINLKDADGNVIETTTTGTGGFYQFCDLVPGSYTVCEVPKSGWKVIGPTCIDVELARCENSEDNDFMNQPEAQKVCETAWAFLDGWECFTKTGNWGSLTEIAPGESLTLTGDVVAGRAKCDQTKGWVVGTATITVSADGYDLDFDLNDDCHVEDLHVWVSNTKPVVKGGFSDKHWYKFESMTGLNLDLTKPIYVAVHTETCCSACNDKEDCTYPAPK